MINCPKCGAVLELLEDLPRGHVMIPKEPWYECPQCGVEIVVQRAQLIGGNGKRFYPRE